MRSELPTSPLCEDCQRSCKQIAGAVVVNCPHYVRIPMQRAIPEMAEPRRGKRSEKGSVVK